ncbi:Nif3-like dinuclear metal center hexameric protein [Christensenellaceae bacterium OttesenSCG-928-K19]|nr:Nif3-like dinuclear metal center hexameric protein [Christensenellaceae bacterium OttesenSCG-928-K19]
MSLNTADVKALIEREFPEEYACGWDNSGFNIDLHNPVENILVCVDVTPDVIKEAAEKKCGLIVSHHPLLFHAIKTIDAQGHIGNCIRLLMEAGISLYCAHTSVDNAPGGINTCLANMLGLTDIEFLEVQQKQRFYKVVVTVPPEDSESVKDALAAGGAGELGNYTRCSFSAVGEGTFLPNDVATPHIGSAGRQEIVKEARIEVLVEESKLQNTLRLVRGAHPYEEPAIDVYVLEEPSEARAGSGVCGRLESRRSVRNILDGLKKQLCVEYVKFRGDLDAEVETVALCGGAGADLIPQAQAMGAQLFITGEVKHNEFVETGINLSEFGHYDTEKCFVGAMVGSLQNVLGDVQCNVAVFAARNDKRPYEFY